MVQQKQRDVVLMVEQNKDVLLSPIGQNQRDVVMSVEQNKEIIVVGGTKQRDALL